MRVRLLLVLAILAAPPRLVAQEPAPAAAGGTIAVFLDCQTHWGCDPDHARRELPYVNWMRDRRDAEVHVLVTSLQTGGGGQQVTLAFIGLRRFAATADTLTHVSANTDTQAEVREAVTRLLKLGLTRFLARTTLAARLDLTYRAPDASATPAAATATDDPWDFWTFRLRGGGNVRGERQQSDRSFNGSVSANRTTEALKVELSVFARTSRGAFTLSDSTEYINTSKFYSADVLVTWSLGPHWSLGVGASADRTTFGNLDLSVAGGPGLEFNVFPYAESTRKKLTVMYSVEPTYFNYEEVTVTGRVRELRARHELQIGTQVQQPWGQIFGSISGTQYFHDPSVHRISTFAGFTLRVFRGLELNLFGDFARIKDQFSLPAADLSDEEILLERRARETDYRYGINFSLSYRFGSKFANVVNPRMGGGDFFMMF